MKKETRLSARALAEVKVGRGEEELRCNSLFMSNATRHYLQRTREKRDRRRTRTLTSRVCRNDIINKVKNTPAKFQSALLNATNDA